MSVQTHSDKQPSLEEWEENWQTDLGGWFPGQRVVFRGKDLFKDLKEKSWMALLLYGITEKVFTQKQIDLFDGIWKITTSYPDPRLWNNRIAALAGTARSTVNLGVSAGIAASEATIFGHRVQMASMEFLLKTQRRLNRGESLSSILYAYLNVVTEARSGAGKNRQVAKIPGFGRPMTTRDERLLPLLELAGDLGFSDSPYIRLAQEIEATLLQIGYALQMNVATLTAALCADQGLTPRQYYHYCILMFSIGLITCTIDAQQKPEGTFFPLRCEVIHYQGKAARQWPNPHYPEKNHPSENTV